MERNAISLIRQNLEYMNPALKRIAEYIMGHLEESKTITTRQLASICNVAESTVTRFVRELGFGGFAEMKINIAEYLTKNQLPQNGENDKIYEDINKDDSTEDVIEKLAYRNTMALTDTQQTLNPEAVNAAVDLIDKADTIIFCCQGFSRIAASEGVMRFLRAGKKCILFEDESVQLMLAAICGPRDVFIGISNTGRTGKVIETLQVAHDNGCSTIAITSFENSPIVHHSDVLLLTPTKSKATETGTTWESASSKTAQILVIDVLCACYTLRHYRHTLKYMDASYQALKNTRVSRSNN